MVHHLAQPRNPRFQAFLAVLVVEKPRIVQPRPHHALVAADDVRRIGDLHVADDQEVVGEFAGAVEQRKVFLVLAHGQDQTFLRHFEEVRVECAYVYRRMFDQCGDFVEQVGVGAQRSLLLFRFGLEQTVDGGAAFGEIGDDLARSFQNVFVVLGVGDGQGGLTHEAVAARSVA